ncbi:MAG: hypothetical protein Q9187_005983 [Circinaria calcarea]
MSSITTSFLGALQASLSVLLTIGYGVIAAQFDLLKGSSAKDISKLCVRLFLPALLITNVGSELHLDTASRYVPVLVWSLFYTLFSMLLGFVATRLFKFPSWATAALSFNNTTSLPLLLIQSLATTGILGKLLMSDSDNESDALKRAQSYFLVCSMVGNSLTFALGPKLLDGEESPDEGEDNDKNKPQENGQEDGNAEHHGSDVEQGNGQPPEETVFIDEETSLLPDSVVRKSNQAGHKSYASGKHYWDRFPPWLRSVLDFLYAFLNAPLIGALIGALIGLTPPLHKAFFNPQQEGGIFKAWLTSSIKNIGELFAALQVVVVGVKLSSSLRKMKKGEESGSVPWKPTLFVLVIRFILWPVVSIAIIYGLVSKTNILSQDPILWFTMMLMPTGPPAMKLTALADVNGSNEGEKMSIAKFLTLAYALCPLYVFAVVGSLTASEAAMSK